jgi:hypothetical protein
MVNSSIAISTTTSSSQSTASAKAEIFQTMSPSPTNESTNYPTPTLILPFGNGIDSIDTGQAPAIILQMQFAGDIEIQEEEEPQFVATMPEDIPIAIVSFLRLLLFNAILIV